MFGILALGNGNLGLGGFDERFQASEFAGPKKTILLEPVIDRLQGLRVELIEAVAATAMFADEMRPAQQAQMLGNGRSGDGEGTRDLAGGLAA